MKCLKFNQQLPPTMISGWHKRLLMLTNIWTLDVKLLIFVVTDKTQKLCVKEFLTTAKSSNVWPLVVADTGFCNGRGREGSKYWTKLNEGALIFTSNIQWRIKRGGRGGGRHAPSLRD